MVRMKDIAERAQVSQSTVSFVLNDRAQERNITEGTRERVLQVASEMGYRPNQIARDMVARKTRALGFLTWDLSHAAATGMLSGVLNEANRHGYFAKVFLLMDEHGSDNWIARCHAHIRSCAEQRLAGVVSVFMPEEIVEHLHQEMAPYDIPVAVVDSVFSRARGTRVRSDDEDGCRQAVEHLAELGHRRIAHLGGQRGQRSAQLRAESFQLAMNARQLPLPDGFVSYGPWDGKDTSERVAALLQHPAGRPTAFFCASDVIAYQAMRALRRAGYRVPDDVSVVGYGDLYPSLLADPALTTVAQPFNAMGELSVRRLLDFDGDAPANGASREDVLPVRLVARESTAPPSKGALR